MESNHSLLYASSGKAPSLFTDWWLPPPPGWIKVNFDSAFDESTGKASTGGLARDPYGNIITAFHCDLRATHPLEAELTSSTSEPDSPFWFHQHDCTFNHRDSDQGGLLSSYRLYQKLKPSDLGDDASLEAHNAYAKWIGKLDHSLLQTIGKPCRRYVGLLWNSWMSAPRQHSLRRYGRWPNWNGFVQRHTHARSSLTQWMTSSTDHRRLPSQIKGGCGN